MNSLALTSCSTYILAIFLVFGCLLGLLVDESHQLLLQRFFILGESILLPSVVVGGWVEVVTLHALLKESDARLVVGLLLEFEGSAVLHEFLELDWLSSAKIFERGFDLLLLDGSVLLVLGSAWETLPWKGSLEHVEQHVADALEIVTSGLLLALMGGDGGISSGTGQVLAIFIGDVLTGAILVALGKTEVDNIDLVTSRLSSANQEVVRLHITMDNSLGVDLLEMVHELDGDEEDSLDIELALAGLEQVFEGWSQHVHDHDVHVAV